MVLTAAYIFTKNKKYYVLDDKSTNGTFVDEREIPRGKEVEIFSSTKLRLGDELFTFFV